MKKAPRQNKLVMLLVLVLVAALALGAVYAFKNENPVSSNDPVAADTSAPKTDSENKDTAKKKDDPAQEEVSSTTYYEDVQNRCSWKDGKVRTSTFAAQSFIALQVSRFDESLFLENSEKDGRCVYPDGSQQADLAKRQLSDQQ